MCKKLTVTYRASLRYSYQHTLLGKESKKRNIQTKMFNKNKQKQLGDSISKNILIQMVIIALKIQFNCHSLLP